MIFETCHKSIETKNNRGKDPVFFTITSSAASNHEKSMETLFDTETTGLQPSGAIITLGQAI